MENIESFVEKVAVRRRVKLGADSMVPREIVLRTMKRINGLELTTDNEYGMEGGTPK